jgi:hypothetical protein
LVEVNHEDYVIPEHGNSLQSRHFDHEGEQVVNDGVQEFVNHGVPVHVLYGLELVVNEQLRGHLDEAEEQDEAHQRRDEERVDAVDLRREVGVDLESKSNLLRNMP